VVADTYTTDGIGVLLMGTGNDNNTWGTNANTNVFQVVMDALVNSLTSVVTGGTLDLSGSPPPAATSQTHWSSLIFTGTLTSAQTVKVPNLLKFWQVKNATSGGGFQLSMQTPSGSATVIPDNSGWQTVYCDGANNIVVFPFNTTAALMPNGSASSPVYAFANEFNSGWYRNGSNDIRFALGGVDLFQFAANNVNILGTNNLSVGGNLTVTGTFGIGDGTVSAPGLFFKNETNTGLYRIGTADVGFTVQGVKRVEVTSLSFGWAGATVAGTSVFAPAISANQNNYNPTGLSTASFLVLDPTALLTITGLAGGVDQRIITVLNNGTEAVKFPLQSGSSSAANQFGFTAALVPGQCMTIRYDGISAIWRLQNSPAPNQNGSLAISAVSPDLAVDNDGGSPNTKRDITVGQVILTDSSGNAVKFLNQTSITIDYTTTGAGGCDVGTRAANTRYFEYLISDGNTVAGMASTTSPLSGGPSFANATNYSYWKYVSSTSTDGSSNLLRVRYRGNRAHFIVGTNPSTAVLIATLSNTSTYSAINVGASIPGTATDVFVYSTSASGVNPVFLAPNPNYYPQTGTQIANSPPAIGGGGSGTFGNSGVVQLGLESGNIYSAASNGSSYEVFLYGWIDGSV
jgi:hypothetical protein